MKLSRALWLGVVAGLTLSCSGGSDEPAADQSGPEEIRYDQPSPADVADTRGGQEIAVADVVGDSSSEDADAGDVKVPPGVPADYLMVVADDFAGAAEALKSYRESTGHSVEARLMSEFAEEDTDDEAAVEAIREWVKEAYDERNPELPLYLVLIGDAVEEGADYRTQVPVSYWPGLWQDCYSDNFYGDLNDDHVPEVAVGRIPVASDAEFESFMERLVRYEQETPVGPWNHRFHVYAGEGGFGEEQDAAIEMVAQKGLEAVPYEYDLLFAYRSPNSKYYYAPFENMVERMVTQGAVLVTYMGHGGGELDVPNLASLTCENRLPLCAFFACSTGDFPAGYDSDAEEAFRLPQGPIAMLVSTATTHPYPNAINALEMEAAVFAERPESFGEAVRIMKWRSLFGTSDIRELLDSLAVLFISREEMENSNVDHQYSYNLLGDPAIRLKLPAQGVSLTGGEAWRGQNWAFSGSVAAPKTGKAVVRVVCARAGLVHSLEDVENPEDPANYALVQSNWEKAMDHVVGEVEVTVTNGAFSGEIAIPTSVSPGKYHAYAYVFDTESNTDAAGSLSLTVKTPQ